MIRPPAVAALVLALGASVAGAQSSRQPSPAPAPPPAATPATEAGWIRRGGAQLQVLDKVNARSKILTLRDGEQAAFGSLTISLRSCLIRAPDQPADSAAFLVMADSHPGGPPFRGWMLQSAPSASMLEHPIYDVRVLACIS